MYGCIHIHICMHQTTRGCNQIRIYLRQIGATMGARNVSQTMWCHNNRKKSISNGPAPQWNNKLASNGSAPTVGS